MLRQSENVQNGYFLNRWIWLSVNIMKKLLNKSNVELTMLSEKADHRNFTWRSRVNWMNEVEKELLTVRLK